jgi:hypothetical protein
MTKVLTDIMATEMKQPSPKSGDFFTAAARHTNGQYQPPVVCLMGPNGRDAMVVAQCEEGSWPAPGNMLRFKTSRNGNVVLRILDKVIIKESSS